MAALRASATHRMRRYPGSGAGAWQVSDEQQALIRLPRIDGRGRGSLYGPCSHYRVKTMQQEMLSIGALAKATGTKIETVRYYERIGLVLLRHKRRLMFIGSARRVAAWTSNEAPGEGDGETSSHGGYRV